MLAGVEVTLRSQEFAGRFVRSWGPMRWFRRDKPTAAGADRYWSRLSGQIAAAKQWRRQATRDYRDLVAEISDILFRADPIGINFGSNTDEYDSEAETIVTALRRAHTPDDVRALTHECFVHWFDTQLAGPASRYDSIAQDIWAAWQRHLAKRR